MTILLACMKKNNFQESFCSAEVAEFKKCHKDHMDAKKLSQMKERQGILNPGERKMSHKQANQLLKKFPV
jgi:hypothetical protein